MYIIYNVRYGDTLETIAENFNMTPQELRNLNGFNFGENVMMGDQIIVPNNKNSYLKSYVVITGDTLYDIARRNNVDLNTLIMLNGLNKNDFLYPGQEIMIPMNSGNVYVVKENDTLEKVISENNISLEELIRRNKNLYLLPDQMIILGD